MNQNNRKVAKNTLILYLRTGISIPVSVLTTSLVLRTLGVVDFGLFGVVTGIVGIFGFINASMTSSTSRFLTFELGQNNYSEYRRVFNASLIIHVLIACAVFVLAETVGLWFLNSQMNIPADRMYAANFIFQVSILGAMISLTQTPYAATIISHEKMNVYARVSLTETLMRLMVILLVSVLNADKLITYSILTFLTSFSIAMFYRLYCNKNFPETKLRFEKDRKLYKKLGHYAGWNLFGNIAGVLSNQGQNILLNVFFGPLANAARGVSETVSGAINNFVTNFQMAANPQIVKYFASDEKTHFNNLVFRSSKVSFFLLLIVGLPILFDTQYLFNLWLGDVPQYAVLFSKLIIINSLINSFSLPLMTACHATGKITFYQTLVGGILLINLPVCYILLKLNYPPYSLYIITIGLSVTSLCARLFVLRRLIKFNIVIYFKEMVMRSILVMFLSLLPVLLIIYNFQDSNQRLLLISTSSLLFTPLIIFLFGMSRTERNILIIAIKTKMIQYIK